MTLHALPSSSPSTQRHYRAVQRSNASSNASSNPPSNPPSNLPSNPPSNPVQISPSYPTLPYPTLPTLRRRDAYKVMCYQFYLYCYMRPEGPWQHRYCFTNIPISCPRRDFRHSRAPCLLFPKTAYKVLFCRAVLHPMPSDPITCPCPCRCH